jgi:hypothetical protein
MRTLLTTWTAKSARSKRLLTLLGVLLLAALAAGYAVAAPSGPDAPTITSGPSGATRATSATFAFKGAGGVTFECALDGGRFAACTSPKTYAGPLADGAHAFQVRAKDRAGQLSAATSRNWTVDTRAPPAPAIVQQPPSLTNLDYARFAYTDGEAGVQYECKVDGHDYDDCTNPVSWWDLHDGLRTFSVRARDAAGNSGPSASYSWRIDTAAPPRPTITLKPANPSRTSTASFSFTDTERGVAFECRLDGAAFASCTSPAIYTALADGRHAFSVRALDAAGNRSSSADYGWTVTAAPPVTGLPFTVRGGFSGLLSPGVSGPLVLTVSNPNGEAIVIESLTTTIQPGSTKPGCDGPANLQVTQSNVSAANPLSVPANGSVTLPSGAVRAPQVLMRNLATNQDACKGAVFSFSFGGSAHS